MSSLSKKRMIDTEFWDDPYTETLSVSQKFAFLYFLTNPRTNIAGVYQITLKRMTNDTGLKQTDIEEILAKFEKDKKVFYVDGWIVVANFIKRQTKNPKVLQGIRLVLKEVPENIRILIPYDSLSIVFEDNNSNSNSNSNLNISPFEAIKSNSEEYKALLKELADVDYLSLKKIQDIVTGGFLPYWEEKGTNDKKARWEKEKSFDWKLRLRKWIAHHHEFVKDWKCAKGRWHRDGERCYCEPEKQKEVIHENPAIKSTRESMSKTLAEKFKIKT